MKEIVFIITLLMSLTIICIILWLCYSRLHALPCPAWLFWIVEFDNPFAYEHKTDVIIEHLALKPGMHALDVGCGPGRLTIPIAKAVGPSGKVVVLDLQQAMLNKVKEKAKVAELTNIEYRTGNIGKDIMLESDFFDRVLLVSVLGEISDQERALRTVFDALKTNKILSITESIFDPHYQSKRKAKRLVQQAGFEIIKEVGNCIAYTIHVRKP